MNKGLQAVFIAIIAVTAIGGVIFGAVKLSGGLSHSGKVSTKCESGQHQKYDLKIKNNSFSPAYINAKYCDTMMITNYDSRGRLMAFGRHDDHIAYDGITERYLTKNESFTVTLNKTGTFLIHDHEQDEVKAEFKVN